MASVNLIIVRHGESVEAVNNICAGTLPGSLSKKGIEESIEIAQKYKDRTVDAIFSSDLKRAEQTAREIAKFHGGIKINFDKRLRERSFGSLQGKERVVLDYNNLPSAVETEEAMQSRANEFIDFIKQEYSGKTVVVVCHSGIKFTTMKILLNKNIDFLETEKDKVHEVRIDK